MFGRFVYSLVLALLIAACSGAAAPTPEPAVRVGATASTLPFLGEATDRSITGSTPFEITVATSNSDLLARVAGDSIDVGLTLYLPENSILWAAPLGEEKIAVVVNPANATDDLSLLQVQDIFAGRTGAWAVAVGEDGDDARIVFEAMALRGVKPALTAVVMPTPEAMLKFVAETPNGIGYLPLRWVDDAVKPLAIDGKPPTADDYPLKALIIAVAKEEPTGKVREWLGEIQKAENSGR